MRNPESTTPQHAAEPLNPHGESNQGGGKMPGVAGSMMASLAYGEGSASQNQSNRGVAGHEHVMDTSSHVDAPHG